MSDSEYESSGPVQCERVKRKQLKESVKRKSSANRSVPIDRSRSDSEYESSGPVQCERVKPKQVKEAVKRKSPANRSVPIDRSRTNKKKAPAPSFDVFNLQEGELPTVRDRKSSATSVLYNRVANGQTRRTAHLDGSFYIELKVFNSADVDAGGDDLWKKSLLWLKLRTNDDTPHWDRVQKFVRQASSLFESEATFYSNNINFK